MPAFDNKLLEFSNFVLHFVADSFFCGVKVSTIRYLYCIALNGKMNDELERI
jgi:hypothetical protein